MIAKKLAVEPIERMLAVLDIVSLSLRAFKRDGSKYDNGDMVDPTEEPIDEDDVKVEVPEDYETAFLEEAVLKMADLLNMVSGDGAAGARGEGPAGVSLSGWAPPPAMDRAV